MMSSKSNGENKYSNAIGTVGLSDAQKKAPRREEGGVWLGFDHVKKILGAACLCRARRFGWGAQTVIFRLCMYVDVMCVCM